MRPNIKQTCSNHFLSDSGRRLPNCFDFTVSYSPVMELLAGVWNLTTWHADVSGPTCCVDIAFQVTYNITRVLLYLETRPTRLCEKLN